MNRSLWPLAAGLILGLAACTAANDVPAASNPQVTVLDPAASSLRADFNHAQGSVRLLLLVDPTCPVCLRGLADVDDALLEHADDPRLQTFVVYESVIGAGADDVPPAARLLHNPHVHHYWDPSGNVGREVSKSLGLEHDGKPVYAWDVWMIYDADAVLPAQGVPPPALFMHQLPELRGQPGRPVLDGEVFAAKARSLLAGLPQTAGR